MRYTDIRIGSKYDPYGECTVTVDDSSGNPYRFQSRRLDAETGLYYFRNRMYHPVLARFLQRDPIGYLDSLCLYEAVRSRPSRLADPSGLQPFVVSDDKGTCVHIHNMGTVVIDTAVVEDPSSPGPTDFLGRPLIPLLPRHEGPCWSAMPDQNVVPQPLTHRYKYGPDCGDRKCCPKKKMIQSNYSYCIKEAEKSLDLRNTLGSILGHVVTGLTMDPHGPGVGDGLEAQAQRIYESCMEWCAATKKAHMNCKEGPAYGGLIAPWPTPYENNADEWWCE